MRWFAILFLLVINGMVWGALHELHFVGGMPVVMLLTAVLSFATILVHELGHAVAAARIGGKVSAIMVLPFELRFRPLRLRLAPRDKHRDLGGYVIYAPPPGLTRRQHLLVTTAGPLANFVLAPLALLLGMWAAAYFSSGSWPAAPGHAGLLPNDVDVLARAHWYSSLQAGRRSQLLANALAILSAGVGVANLIPFAGSDGATILRLLRPHRTA